MSVAVLLSQIRDDNKRQHPCLVDFSKLPETEKNYNLQMSTETLKYVEPYGSLFSTVVVFSKGRECCTKSQRDIDGFIPT